MRWRPLLWRLGAVLLLIGGGYMGYRSYEEHVRNAKIQDEIEALEREAEKIRRENKTLAERIEYFASPDYQEQEAKKKLGLRRQEESMMMIREEPNLEEISTGTQAVSSGETLAQDKISNYKKWWYQFFPPKN